MALGMPLQKSGGGFLGALFAGFFDGGGQIPSGKFGVVGERGAELVSGPAHVTSRADTAKLMQGGYGGVAEIIVRSEPGVVVEIARNEAGAVIRRETPGIVGASVSASQRSLASSKDGWAL